MPATSGTMQPLCAEWQLSDFCRERDQSSLPIFDNEEKVIVLGEDSPSPEEIQQTVEWNCLNKQLLLATTSVRNNKQAIQFLEKWLLRSLNPLSHISDAALGECVTSDNDVPIKDIQAMLQERRVCTRNKLLELSRAMDIFLGYKLKGIESPTRAIVQLNPFDPPLTLIRIWNDKSHTIHTKSLGFRCGNWKKCQPANNFIEMKNKKLLNLERISDHCEDKRSPSDWISFSDSALWILSKRSDSFLPAQRNCYVAIINVASLDKLRIPWQRSDLLVQQLGGNVYSTNKSGVQYAWPGHYLVYGWVPSQCIVKLFTLKEFTNLCKQRSIVKGTSLILYSL